MQISRTVEATGTDEDVDMQTATMTGGTSTPAIIPTEDKPASAPRITELTSGSLADDMHVCENCGGSPSPRLKLIRDIDTSLTSSVLEYLKGGGYFEAVRGMEGVLRRRAASESDIDNNNDDNTKGTAERDVDEDMDKDEGKNAVEDDKQVATSEVSEEETLFLRLKACREAYVRGDMYQVVSFLLNSNTNTNTNTGTGNVETTTSLTEASCSSPSAQEPLVDADFLQGYKGGIWALRIRLQHFYSLFRGDVSETSSALDSRSSGIISEFFYGEHRNSSSTPSDPDQKLKQKKDQKETRLISLLAAGQHLHACHSASTEKEVVEGLDVFALMAYENVDSAPAGLVNRMGEAGRRREAGELFGDVRGKSLHLISPCWVVVMSCVYAAADLYLHRLSLL
jgi:hypothetical protein